MKDHDDEQRQTETSGRGEGWNAIGLVSMIGADMAICTVGGTYLGMWLDRVLGTEPWMLLAGVVLGLVAGIFGIIKLLELFGPGRK